MSTLLNQIRESIEEKLDAGYKKFIIFPFGSVGMQVKQVLNNVYGIQESYVFDNHLCKYNSRIKKLSFCSEIDCENYCIIIASTNLNIYENLKQSIKEYFPPKCIAEIFLKNGGYLKQK